MVYPFRLSIHGYAFVTQALAPEAKPVDPESDCAVGAEVRGESLWGYAGKVSRPELKQLTGGHKGTEVAAQRHALVRLETPLRQVLERAALAVPKGF